MYLWIKALHIIFVVTWFAALFYLPRLYVYHAMCEDETGRERFKVMERKLYRGIMTPSAILAVGLGLWMLALPAGQAWLGMGWLHAKLTLVVLLIGYHWWCGRLLVAFREDRNRHSHRWYRWFNEAPVLVLIAVVLLVVLKPF
ncbi:protoporphyrinogen oxidase HemJ [Alkalilimnicola sp. S0819]|uniref:protoporphyrinogen oxidase HemJ n=1 Tax=Alkalilimnicola sp. S0819 TaxID=2613922 RepID=UPI00126224BC|nr:protoporphyrinogen oxidase HemJ [Alkalilimnicola sp. S0819]KAB7623039.1 protoporphyrinogen oxidase HemJ [Alkalilimnicola sp. S0819]MPQ17152.1 protoporphyrinogen oxidase HemJ [Alkalilimnicola sp. S0819]